MKRLAMIALALALFACGTNPFNPQPTGDPVVDILTTARGVLVAGTDAAPDLVNSGDLTAEDAAWIAEHTPEMRGHIDTALRIAKGQQSGDILAEYDAWIAGLRALTAVTHNEGVKVWLSRVTAGVVIYRSALAAQLTSQTSMLRGFGPAVFTLAV